MSDDLVKRLQDYLDCRPWAAGRTFDPTHPECLIAQAKDRIEALDKALQTLTTKLYTDLDGGRKIRRYDVDIARAALGEKKE